MTSHGIRSENKSLVLRGTSLTACVPRSSKSASPHRVSNAVIDVAVLPLVVNGTTDIDLTIFPVVLSAHSPSGKEMTAFSDRIPYIVATSWA
jgi:hypothetical protein